MEVAEILTAITRGTFNNQEINQLAEAVKYARSQVAAQKKIELWLGDTVKFKARSGMWISGILRERKIKNAIVETNMGRYRVPFSMLEAA